MYLYPLYMTNENKIFPLLWLIGLVLVPIVLWILPASFFNEGQATCLSRIFFDVECFFCGITRAVMHFHHFEFEEAIYYNMLVVLVYPALVGLWCLWTYQSYKKLRQPAVA